MFGDSFRGRRVLVTGHTGFKGSWMSTWLVRLGARVGGFAIDIPTQPSAFETLGLPEHIDHFQGDIRDRTEFCRVLDEVRPEVVFHLAAQALVRRSYVDPAYTFEVNTLGTLNVLEALRTRPWVSAAVLVTSDKCYRNVEWVWGYRENDALGGDDPYSGSKGAAELVAHSYLSSFFATRDAQSIATARAGNVIGGGDWAEDRIVPDCIRAWTEGKPVTIRAPRATRPWQHVLEPLSGYLWLASRLMDGDSRASGEAFNFGPSASVDEPVEKLITLLGASWPGSEWQVDPTAMSDAPEAGLLKLSCDKARSRLGWEATLSFPETVEFTMDWYRRFHDGESDMWQFTLDQIGSYEVLASRRAAPWCADAGGR